jgi:anti-anti-sigma factor
MADVESGEIMVADHQGVYVIKMTGDVRLNLCIAFDECIEKLFSRDGFQSILFDLTGAQNLDSTTLGLIAKVAIKCKSQHRPKPIVFCDNPAIQRLQMTMGLDEVCEAMDKPPLSYASSSEFHCLPPCSDEDEDKVKAKVLESHSVLMALNEKNRQTFQDLVQTLKSV